MPFKGKTILLIAPKFYGYHQLIIRHLEQFGAKVIYFPERTSGFIASLKSMLGVADDKATWQTKVQKKIEGIAVDYLFVIKGENITADFIDIFKQHKPNSKLLMYQWDSIVNHDYTNLINRFDGVFSFDPVDVENEKGIKYLPLFYHEKIKAAVNSEKSNEDIDLLLVGSYLPERYAALQELINYAQVNHLNFYHYLFVPRSYYYQLSKKGTKLDKALVKFNSLNDDKLIALYRRSKAFVDVSSVKQNGFSMRAVECLGAQKKLITNNKNILNSKLYSTGQVLYFDLKSIIITKQFLDADVVVTPYAADLYIDNWLTSIFKSFN